MDSHQGRRGKVLYIRMARVGLLYPAGYTNPSWPVPSMNWKQTNKNPDLKILYYRTISASSDPRAEETYAHKSWKSAWNRARVPERWPGLTVHLSAVIGCRRDLCSCPCTSNNLLVECLRTELRRPPFLAL
jgi:hypothetical protein